MKKSNIVTLLFLVAPLFATSVFATLNVSISGTNSICYGVCDGTLSATASGGSGNYTYTWSHGLGSSASIYGLCAGMYSVYVTDGQGDYGFAFGTVTEPTQLTASIATTNPLCFGVCDGESEVTASGGTQPYYYYWSNGSTQKIVGGLCGGQVDVSVYDNNGCVTVVSTNVIEPAEFIVTASGTDPSSSWWCDGSVWANSTGGTGTALFVWGGIGSGASHFSSVCPGTYTVTGTDQNGCVDTDQVTLNYPFWPAIDNSGNPSTARMSAANANVSINNNQLTIDVTTWADQGAVSATVLDISGQVVATQNFTGTKTQLDISEWSSGMYLVETVGAEQRNTTKVMVP